MSQPCLSISEVGEESGEVRNMGHDIGVDTVEDCFSIPESICLLFYSMALARTSVVRDWWRSELAKAASHYSGRQEQRNRLESFLGEWSDATIRLGVAAVKTPNALVGSSGLSRQAAADMYRLSNGFRKSRDGWRHDITRCSNPKTMQKRDSGIFP